MEEIWKDIIGYEGHYQVSNLGNVRSIKFNRIKLLTPYKEIKRYGYLSVYLRLPGSKKIKKVHRLVAEAFIPNPDNLPCVNHIDENKENNCVENLEWCTVEYNLNYGTRIEKFMKRVSQYSIEGNFIKTYNSEEQAAKETNSKARGISNCVRGRQKTHNGFIWKYTD